MKEFFSEHILPIFFDFGIVDIIDILIVAFVLYRVMNFLRTTRAVQVIKGIIVILIVMYLSSWLNLNVISYILSNTMQVGLIALIIMFQPELRRGLEHVGRGSWGKFFSFDVIHNTEDNLLVTDEIVLAVDNLSRTKTGALIVIERDNLLNDVLKSGSYINADVKAELIINLFVPNTPLHDGALIVRNNKIVSASCVLPLTQNVDINRELGTRHRAALGLSEITGAIIVVVSEETGKISLAIDGNMKRSLSVETLRKSLNFLLNPEVEGESKLKIKRWKGRVNNV